VDIVKIVESKGYLLQMVIAGYASCGFSCCLNGGQEKGNQHPDNRNDDEKFNECKSSIAFHGFVSKKGFDEKTAVCRLLVHKRIIRSDAYIVKVCRYRRKSTANIGKRSASFDSVMGYWSKEEVELGTQ